LLSLVLALTAMPAVSSAQGPTCDPMNQNDTTASGAYNSNAVDAFSFGCADAPQAGVPAVLWNAGAADGWVQANIGQRTFSGVSFLACSDPASDEQFRVLGSNDGATFTELAQSSATISQCAPPQAVDPITFAPVTYTWLRIEGHSTGSWLALGYVKILS
jgi:hypothetical protein